MGSLSVGDKVYSRNGKLYNIVGVFPQGKKQVWNIKFYDGRTIDCCQDHLWTVKKGTKEVVLSTKEMYDSGVIYNCSNKKHAFKYKVPITDPIDYPEATLPIDPYLLGCLLGNGTLTTATPKIATDDQFIIDEITKRLPNFKIELDKTCNNYTIVDKDTSYDTYKCEHKHRNSFTALLCENKLNVGCVNKFIPSEYKTASIEQRMELVRGLLDTDGWCGKDGHIEFSNLSERLIDDLMDVLRSLGITCIKSHENREGQTFKNPAGKECVRKKQFRIYINSAKPIFKLPRKLNNIKKE
jgi:replicative DNA helicase